MSVSSVTSKLLLTKSLVRPSKIANALDWRKMTGSTVLSLNIHADRIGIALAGHPSSTQLQNNTTTTTSSSNSVYHVESLPLHQTCHATKNKGQQVPPEVRQRLSDIVRTHNVCGFVVSWPIQKDTGRLGASCGRTLHTLEQLLLLSSQPQPQSESSSKPTATATAAAAATIFSPSRPICLWDSTHAAKNQPRVDKFGRSVAFSYSSSSSSSSTNASSLLPPPPTTHSARQLQYHQDETISAEQVWDDFARTFWPEQLEQPHQQQAPRRRQQQHQQQRQHQQHKNQHRSQYQEPECDDLSSIPSLAFAA